MDQIIDNYKITTKINKKLSEELQINNITFKLNENIDWKPPEKHGLTNSDVIIP